MSTKDLFSLWTFVAVAVLAYKYFIFNIPQDQTFLATLPNLQGSWSLKMEKSKSEICMGRRCAVAFEQNKSNVDVLTSSLILSLIGLAIYLTVMYQRWLCAAGPPTRKANHRARTLVDAFKRTSHSTSIGISSLSPSPVPRMERLLVQDRQDSRNAHSKIPWDRMAKASGYEVCLSLQPSPQTSASSFTASSNIGSYSDGPSSNSGLYPCAPPSRWRGNSRLNLATSPEVVPHDVDQYYHL